MKANKNVSALSYNPSEIEERWQKKWQDVKIYSPDLDSAKKPFYNLMMFPYPSAEGLHVGNMYAFSGADIYGRFKRMQGFSVFEPIGLDGFGIHSENYAIKVGRTPQEHAKISEENFYNQLHRIGNSFDTTREVETYDPKYYRWTQWLFIQLFKAGLAYRAYAAVNYCPSCKTVLADEQVIDGKCERCGTMVEKKNLEQWFFKITNYAQKLLTNIENLDWSEKVKIAQKNWIGKSEGARIKFPIENSDRIIEIFTTRPDTLYGVSFVVVAPEHPFVGSLTSKESKKLVETYQRDAKQKSLIERTANIKDKTGVFLGSYALHPLTGESLPIYIADYVLMEYGTGAIMGVPAHDERDYNFAQNYNLAIKQVIAPSDDNNNDMCYKGSGVLKNSESWNGLKYPEDKNKIIAEIEKRSIGQSESSYHLRDWLISRQRYWGPPIPMIYCESCKWQPVPEKDLPVLLPQLNDWKPTGDGKGPLAKLEEWVMVRCPNCGGDARRETDVSDSFLDSSWYFFRYTSSELDDKPFDKERINKWLPVNMYIGGAEHSVLHLLYARFITHVLHDLGLIDFSEPFMTFFAHGLIIKDGAKMSKSKGNIVVPDEYINKFGADSLRSYLAFIGPFSQGGDFSDSGMEGIYKFMKRIWTLFNSKALTSKPVDKKALYMMHKTIKGVTVGISDFKYNTSLALLMEYYNFLSSKDELYEDEVTTFLKLIAPFAPHMAEELWQTKVLNAKSSKKKIFESIHLSLFPVYDEQYIIPEDSVVVIQVNGKLKGKLLFTNSDAILQDRDALIALAKKEPAVDKYLSGKNIKHVIYIKGKLLNFVAA